MRAEHDHRHGSAAHNQAQCFQAIHSRHFQVEGDDVRVELFDLFQRKRAIHGCADHFNGGIPLQDGGDELAHAIAPKGVARERRERTAGTFRISTTVPSPRIEAPLTRSLEIISVGSALITNSSSPTMLSTMRPKRFSAAPITITKLRFFFLASGALTA